MMTSHRADQATHQHGGVGAPGQFETKFYGLIILLLATARSGTCLEVLGQDHQWPLLMFEGKARNALDDQVIGTEFVLCQSQTQMTQLIRILHLRKTRAGQRESSVPGFGELDCLARKNQTALTGQHSKTLTGIEILLEPGLKCQIPKVRLKGVEVNQALASRDPMKSTGPIPVIAPQMLKNRVVLAVASGVIATGTPVAPAAPDRRLGVSGRRGIKRRKGSQEALEGIFLIPTNQIEHDPALAMTQITKALLVEVVGVTMLTHRGNVLAHASHLPWSEFAHNDAEAVADRGSGAQRLFTVTHSLDLQIGLTNVHLLAAGHTHVLNRNALTILQTRHGNISGGHPHQPSQIGSSLKRSDLALVYPVDPLGTSGLNDVFTEQFRDAKVLGS